MYRITFPSHRYVHVINRKKAVIISLLYFIAVRTLAGYDAMRCHANQRRSETGVRDRYENGNEDLSSGRQRHRHLPSIVNFFYAYRSWWDRIASDTRQELWGGGGTSSRDDQDQDQDPAALQWEKGDLLIQKNFCIRGMPLSAVVDYLGRSWQLR